MQESFYQIEKLGFSGFLRVVSSTALYKTFINSMTYLLLDSKAY